MDIKITKNDGDKIILELRAEFEKYVDSGHPLIVDRIRHEIVERAVTKYLDDNYADIIKQIDPLTLSNLALTRAVMELSRRIG